MAEKTVADLVAGDEVAIRIGYSNDYHIYKVAKIGPRGIIELETGTKYKPDGTSVSKGDKWNRPNSIEPVTDEIRRTIRKSKLVSKLSGLDFNQWKKMDLETLEAIAALIWKKEQNHEQ